MQSEQIDKLAEALAKAQGAIKNPVKNRKVTVTTQTGGRYEFKYADLTAIIDAVKTPLADNNIGYVQFVEEDPNGKFRLITKLMHNSGQWIESRNPLFLTKRKDRDGNELPPGSQEFGSAQTFMKRYALAGMLGVSADEDDDANIAEGNVAEQQEVKGRKPKPPATSIVKESTMPINQKQPVSPREMPPMAGGDWITWGRELLDAIQIADPDDRLQWLALNRERVKLLSEEAPKVFLRFSTALENLKIDKDLIATLRSDKLK